MPHISLPTLPTSLKVSKRLLLVIAGSLSVILVLLVSLAVYQRHNDRLAAKSAQKAAAASQAVKANTERIASLESQVKALQAQRAGICGYVATLTTQKATRSLVTVPAQYCQ